MTEKQYAPMEEIVSDRFRLIGFDDIAVNRDRAYIVKGIIPRDGLTIVWGPPKCGKSFWTFDLSMHVALDLKYRERRVSPGPVVYIACEGAAGFRARVEAFWRKFLVGNTSPIPFFLMGERIDLTKDYVSMIREIRIKSVLLLPRLL